VLFTQLLGRAIQNLEGRRNMFVGNYNRRKEAGEKAYDFQPLPTPCVELSKFNDDEHLVISEC
jgi:hypothetical protein